MTDSSSGKRQASTTQNRKKNAPRGDALASSEGVLANLPRTRPQRSSARREDARRETPQAAATPAVAKAETKAQAGATAKAKTRAQAKAVTGAKTETKAASGRKRAPDKPVQDPAPRQGFEAESDPLGGSVRPPGGMDVFASAAELAGELTKNSLSHGGRMLKDLLTRLPLN
jgi:hypothetical protein